MSAKPASDIKDRPSGDKLALDSAVLARLIEEVRNNEASAPTAYNRMHNRHNR